MRNIIILLNLTALLVGVLAWTQLHQFNAAPNIRIVGGEVYDAGNISGKQRVTHTFTIVNPHPFAIGLTAPESGCSCTTATASSSVIPPNGSADITLKVEPEGGNLSGSAFITTSHRNKTIETWLFINGKTAR